MISGLSPMAIAQIGEAVAYSAGGAVGPAPIYIDINLEKVEALLEELVARADAIVEVLKNPDATAAEEKLRKAAIAMNRGWFDDAERDLRESIALYKYRGLPHFLLGVACLHLGRPVEALTHLDDAVKYGVEDDQRAAVTAGLLAITLLAAAGLQHSLPNRLEELEQFGLNREVDYLLHVHGLRDRTDELLRFVETRASADDPTIRLIASVIPDAVANRTREIDTAIQSLRSYGATFVDVFRQSPAELPSPVALVNHRPSVHSSWFQQRSESAERIRASIADINRSQERIRGAAFRLKNTKDGPSGLRESLAFGNSVCATCRELTTAIVEHAEKVDTLASRLSQSQHLLRTNGDDPFAGAVRPKFTERKTVAGAADLMRTEFQNAIAIATSTLAIAQANSDTWSAVEASEVAEVFRTRVIGEPNRPLGSYAWVVDRALS